MSSSTLRVSVELPPAVSSVGAARRLVADLCGEARTDDVARETAMLLTSEVATNAVRYGGGTFLLEAAVAGGSLRVVVSDGNPHMPEMAGWPDATAEGGRGLALVASLAARWGVERDDGGKAVWFELDVDC